MNEILIPVYRTDSSENLLREKVNLIKIINHILLLIVIW
jgi:hypothetical protein